MIRRGARRPAIGVLLATVAAVEKLGARGISVNEAEQVRKNRYVVVRNPRRSVTGMPRFLLIGCTDGGRVLTTVIEQTVDPSTWLIVTAWPAANNERRILGDRA
jgi:uncharacterized DUF497 family protein